MSFLHFDMLTDILGEFFCVRIGRSVGFFVPIEPVMIFKILGETTLETGSVDGSCKVFNLS